MDAIVAFVEYELGAELEDALCIVEGATLYGDWQMVEIGKSLNAVYSILDRLNEKVKALISAKEGEEQ